jgi:hypothetical protein
MPIDAGGAQRWCLVFLLCLQSSGCALPSIHRDDAAVDGGALPERRDGGGSVSGMRTALSDKDSGPGDNPSLYPENRNEDLETFRSLLPNENLWAKWSMPDTDAHARRKPSYTASDAVIVDNVTQLKWQRELPEIYPGCEAEYEFVGTKRGVGTGCTWEEARAYCSSPELAQQLGGGSWRLPTKIELESLIDVSRVNAVDPLFDGFPIDRVWSGSPVPNPDGLKLAWAVDFMEGVSMDSARYKGGRVRCVSSQSQPGGRTPDYRVDRDVVRDGATQLDWQRVPSTMPRNFLDAAAYCQGLSLAGAGWRVPTLKELLTLVDTTQRDPATERRAFEELTQSERYWTSTAYLNQRDAHYKVDFMLGGTTIRGTSSELYYVRCVR